MREHGRRAHLTTVFRPLLAVHSSRSIYPRGVAIANKYRLAWYDAIIVAGAVESGCETLFSEDLQNGAQIENVCIKNPFV